MNYRHIAIAAALLCGATPALSGPRAVIELFTSQGCSSCPPADKLLGELARDPSLLTMSLPVDYWDYLGWKDTLALHGHSNRQHAYAAARGDRQVYTPQVVINGLVHALGSDKAAIERAIAQSRQSGEALALPVTMTVDNGTVTVTVPAAQRGERRGEVWLCPVTSKVPVEIRRGENSGHTLTYHDVVRGWIKLGDWNGTAQTFTYKVSELADHGISQHDIDRLDVIVQGGLTAKPGVMFGAATAALP